MSAQSYTRTWQSCFNDVRPSIRASAIDSSGNVFIAGYLYHDSDGLHDTIFLKKYSTSGALLWEVHEPFTATTAWNLDVPLTIATDRSGNVILSYSFSFVQSNLDAVINKYNSSGTRLWQTVFDGPADVDNEQIKKLIVDSKGSIYLLMAENYNYGTLARFTSSGKLQWYRDMRGTVIDGTPTDYIVSDATIDSSGNAYATGVSARLHNGLYHDAVTYRFFANGDSSWQVRYGENYVDNYGVQILYAKGDNSLVVVGYSERQHSDSLLVIKYTTGGGKKIWTYVHYTGGNGRPGDPIVDADNNIFLVTNYASEPAPPPVLTKLSPTGSVLWTKDAFAIMGSQAPVYEIVDVKTDAQSNYYCISNQLEGVLTQKFDKSGNVLAQIKEGPDNFIPVDYYGISYAAVYVGKNQSIYTPVSYDYNYRRGNRCVFKYTMAKTLTAGDALSSSNLTTISSSGYQYSIYPNPAHNSIRIQVPPADASRYTVQVFTASGKQVLTCQYAGATASININALSLGVYVMKITSGAGQVTQRFIKE